MQSLAAYGRLLARTIFAGVHNELPQPWNNQIQSQGKANELRLVSAASGFSKTQTAAQVLKKWSFGDDACFIAGHKLADVIGVADGVGGWRTYGIDPSLFARSLMATCERIVQEGHFQPQAPVGIIAAGYYELQENKNHLIGSCTACVVSLHREDSKLYTANLGDSGFMLVREGEVVHYSQEQQHYFNTPFQLALAPNSLQGIVLSDSPESAQSTSFNVQEGDIILVGSDGLFDNLSEDMILGHLSKLKDHRLETVQSIANAIAREAHELSFDPTYMSPFAMNAVANGFECKGGKPDDITVLLARVAAADLMF